MCGHHLREWVRRKHVTMRWLIIVSTLLLFGCQAHQPPDEVVSGRLRAAVEVTTSAMALPAEQRPSGRELDDQIGLLAMRLSVERVQKIDSGTFDRAVVVEAYQNALKRRAARQGTSMAPQLLVFLIDQQAQWSRDQTLLAAALLAQYEQEARLTESTPGLAR